MNDNFYRQLVKDGPIGYAYNKIICDMDGIPCDYEFIDVNESFKTLMGYNDSTIVGRKISDILHKSLKSELKRIRLYGDIAINGGEKEFEQFSYSLKRWYKVIISSPEKNYFIMQFIDITTDAIFYNSPGMLYLYDDQKKLVRWNKNHEIITGYSSNELCKMSIWDWFNGDNENNMAVIEGFTRPSQGGLAYGEAELKKKDGTTIPMYFTGNDLYLGDKQYFFGIAIDITERKKKDRKIFYLSYHDQLTGLYNRRFYEEELKRLDTGKNLPLTIVMGDVNGLKLINDSFGHIMGDRLLKKVAEVIRLACRVNDVICRLSGDEFIIILPKSGTFEAEQIIKHIISMLVNEKIGDLDISISFGYETKNTKEEEIEDIFKNAENHMYNKKIFESPSMRGKTINAMINTLYEKNKREEQHSRRVSELCKSMGVVLGLTEYEIAELKSVGLLHDIGKIAINENVLNKPGKLTNDEWNEIKRHPEIGYRMLNNVNNMSNMANDILYHHERWDGSGYPKGLKGNEIPFISRIIAIADAYDAMTSERSYRSELPTEIVIQELQNNSGIQFDPELLSVFLEKIVGIKTKLI